MRRPGPPSTGWCGRTSIRRASAASSSTPSARGSARAAGSSSWAARPGIAGLDGLPEDLLPFSPTATIDVPRERPGVAPGHLPAGTAPVPALTGDLVRGSVPGWSDGQPIAAQGSVGQGTWCMLGIDPSSPRSPAPRLPAACGGGSSDRCRGRRSTRSCSRTTARSWPRSTPCPRSPCPTWACCSALLALYIALIGPVNYLVLRRIDRREWAWVTMPVLVLVFGVGTYAMGMGLKGTDMIVNQLAIVRAAAGTDRGIGQAYVGIFSPNRQTYDVTVGDDALLANPIYLSQGGNGWHAPGRGRRRVVAAAGLRGRLRGPARVPRRGARAAPRVDADLTYRDGVLEGTLTNRSDETLESVAVDVGRQATLIPDARARRHRRCAARHR